MKHFAIAVLFLVAQSCAAQATAEERSWNQPVTPFHLAGNIYYVGANDITSFLITSPQGHILLDGGFAETAPQIEANIEKLGFHLRDVKVLINSHGHSDHAGGLAELKRATGARLLIAPGDADAVAHGGHNDFAFANRMLFPAVKADALLKDGDEVRVGSASMIAHLTPGHTRGCTTWTTKVEEDGKSYDVTFLCSTSVPGYNLLNNAAYPNIVEDYRASFARLRKIHTDIFLGSHGRFFHLTEKRAAMGKGKSNPFVVPGEYAAFLEDSEKEFSDKLLQQQSKAAKPNE